MVAVQTKRTFEPANSASFTFVRVRIMSTSASRTEEELISSGSSADPISLLRIAGVDMSTPDPVNSALELFGDLIGEMEELVSGK